MMRLPRDHAPTGMAMKDYLAGQTGPVEIVAAIAEAVPDLAVRLAEGRLTGDPTEIVGINDSGDKQKALDLAAHDHMVGVLRAAGVRRLLSEEAEAVVDLDPEGLWDVAMDPIDGSGSIGIGAPLGLLFSILPASAAGFLRRGREVVAAGYVSFGHSVDFGFSLGRGVVMATYYAPEAQFRISQEGVRIAAAAKVVAYNASNERHWPQGLKHWAEDIRAGKTGPRGRDFNMRWLAAAVGEVHRILLQGGCFLYPGDQRPGYERGRLRTLYEAVPIAYLIEQAGGKATDGLHPILDRLPEDEHEHTPLVFGSAEEVDLIADYLRRG